MPVILLTNHYTKLPLKIIEKSVPPGFQLISLKRMAKEELVERAKEADYLLASGRLAIDREVLDATTNLKMIQRTGVGLDSLDLSTIRSRGIPIYVNSGINARSVAEHTMLLILAALRRLPLVNSDVKNGKWQKQEQGVQTHELCGKTVGLVGMGNIGSIVAKLLQSFKANVIYYDRLRLSIDVETELGIEYAPLEELIARVDILSLHCPLSSETKGLIGERELTSMKSGVVIVNTARGQLVDEKALVHHLRIGRIGAAALDVFEVEPLPQTSHLLRMDNVILTPHIGGITYDSFHSMMTEAMSNIRLFEEGKVELLESRRLKI